MQEGAASLDRGQLIHCLFRGHTCALYIVLVIQPAYLHLRLRVLQGVRMVPQFMESMRFSPVHL